MDKEQNRGKKMSDGLLRQRGVKIQIVCKGKEFIESRIHWV
jgi:hypothetical protein